MSHGNAWKIVNPYIELHCEHDDGVRRFAPASSSFFLNPTTHKFIVYRCRDCQSIEKTFAVLIDHWDFEDLSNVEVMKLGEYPPFSAPISSRIQKLLSDSDLELYRKGVRAEARASALVRPRISGALSMSSGSASSKKSVERRSG